VIERHPDDPDLIKVAEIAPERPAPQWATITEFAAWAEREDEAWCKRRLHHAQG
jgi:hypothetical protein